MCEFSTKLVRWLDQELPGEEALVMDQHVAACAECQGLADGYRDASRNFALLAKSIVVQGAGPARKRRAALWVASGIAAALVTLFLVTPRESRRVPPAIETAARLAPAAPVAVAPALESPVLRTQPPRPVPARRISAPERTWLPAQPTIQIAIPSDALFPPGALPEGVAFLADLSLAADGSPAELVLRP